MNSNDSREFVFNLFVENLPFDPSDEAITECLDEIANIEETLPPPSRVDHGRESAGRPSEDDYNALLDVYVESRERTNEGDLSDLTFAVKDNIAVADLETTCGAAGFSWTPPFDAVAVERLLAAGAACVGKANMEPFAFGRTGTHSDFGPVRNPRDDGLIAGGSSSGSAAAVAAGLVDVALGTDNGGSVRVPAACCGVVGVKPTPGLVPQHGVVPPRPTSIVGPIARNVATAADVLDVIVGYDPRDPAASFNQPDSLALESEVSAVTVGLVESAIESASETVADATLEAGKLLAEQPGIQLRTVSFKLPDPFPLSGPAFVWLLRQRGVLRGQETWSNESAWRAFDSYLSEHGFGDHVASRVLPAAFLDRESNGRVCTAVRADIARFRRRLLDFFETVDILLTPTMPCRPPSRDALTDDIVGSFGRYTYPFSLAGVPAVSVPAVSHEPVPTSVQIVAPPMADGLALQVASLVERGVD